MMKRRSIEKVKTIKKEKEKEQLIGYLDSLVILKDDVNIIKLKISHEYG